MVGNDSLRTARFFSGTLFDFAEKTPVGVRAILMCSQVLSLTAAKRAIMRLAWLKSYKKYARVPVVKITTIPTRN